MRPPGLVLISSPMIQNSTLFLFHFTLMSILALGRKAPACAMHPDRFAERIYRQRPASAPETRSRVAPQESLTFSKQTLLTFAKLPNVKGFNQIPAELVEILPWIRFEEFDRGFVSIPGGYLPQKPLPVEPFEAAKSPVTRELWNELMPDLRVNLDHCPSCPVTEVAWENTDGAPAEVQTFLERLNKRTKLYRCTYDLPTDLQLWYLIRADLTGSSQAPFSIAQDRATGERIEINYKNADQYVIHEANSKGRVQPIGSKKTNAFEIELGNVWKMTKDLIDETQPLGGRTARGGSWFFDVSCAESNYRTIVYPGDRQNFVGFSLVRKCH